MIRDFLAYGLYPDLAALLIIIGHVDLGANLQQHTLLEDILDLPQAIAHGHHRTRPQPISLLVCLHVLAASHNTLHGFGGSVDDDDVQQQSSWFDADDIIFLDCVDIVDLLFFDQEVPVFEFDIGDLHVLEELAFGEDLLGHPLYFLFDLPLQELADRDNENDEGAGCERIGEFHHGRHLVLELIEDHLYGVPHQKEQEQQEGAHGPQSHQGLHIHRAVLPVVHHRVDHELLAELIDRVDCQADVDDHQQREDPEGVGEVQERLVPLAGLGQDHIEDHEVAHQDYALVQLAFVEDDLGLVPGAVHPLVPDHKDGADLLDLVNNLPPLDDLAVVGGRHLVLLVLGGGRLRIMELCFGTFGNSRQ